MSNLKYWLWLAGRKGLAGQNAMRVLNHFGSPERVYYSDKEEYQLIPGLSAGALSSLEDKSLDGANRILGDCDRLGIRVLTLQDSIYPERLAAIHQPPMVLYLKGRGVSFDEEAAIAIVGTRSATPYGLWAATKLSMDLTASGALIVSGMAEGIDAAALRGALKAGGPVVSVLAGGIDVIYPRENRPLYEDVAAVGTLISEHPPGTAHIGSHFPVRNRIISGLSAGVIAIESKRFGGTMYTVSHALDQNREVFAVPGPIGAEASEGTTVKSREQKLYSYSIRLFICSADTPSAVEQEMNPARRTVLKKFFGVEYIQNLPLSALSCLWVPHARYLHRSCLCCYRMQILRYEQYW